MSQLYFSQLSDTPVTAKQRFPALSAQDIVVSCINKQSQLTPFTPLLSDSSQHVNCQHYLAQFLPDSSYILSNLQKNDAHPKTIVALYHLLKDIIHHSNHHVLDSGLAGAQILEHAAHLRHSQLHSLHHLADHLFHALKHFAESTSQEVSHTYHELYCSLRHEMKSKFRQDFKRFLSKAEHFFHEDIWQSIRNHTQSGWHITHEIALKELSHVAEYIKQIADGMFVLDITGALIDAGEIVAHDHDWFVKLSHLTVDVEAFFVSSIMIDTTLVMLSLTPIGWLGCIFVGAATLISQHELMQHALTPYLNYINNRYRR